MQKVNVEILKKPGAWILERFYKFGQVVAVEKRLAMEHLLKARSGAYALSKKAAEVDSTAEFRESDEDRVAREELEDESRDSPPSEIYDLDFPGKDDLLKVGINSIEQLDTFIADNGDAWFKKVNGIGAKTAKDIVAFREKQRKS